jgi:tRNA (adenine-N(1)-)-methyltransferase non-catalytic subunit
VTNPINQGEGRLLAITDIDGPPAFHIVRNMNFDPSVVTPVLASLNWAAVDEDYTPS